MRLLLAAILVSQSPQRPPASQRPSQVLRHRKRIFHLLRCRRVHSLRQTPSPATQCLHHVCIPRPIYTEGANNSEASSEGKMLPCLPSSTGPFGHQSTLSSVWKLLSMRASMSPTYGAQDYEPLIHSYAHWGCEVLHVHRLEPLQCLDPVKAILVHRLIYSTTEH